MLFKQENPISTSPITNQSDKSVYNSKYYQKNKSNLLENGSSYYKNHKEQKKEYSKQYREKNKLKIKLDKQIK